jgi:hypothetical protein
VRSRLGEADAFALDAISEEDNASFFERLDDRLNGVLLRVGTVSLNGADSIERDERTVSKPLLRPAEKRACRADLP